MLRLIEPAEESVNTRPEEGGKNYEHGEQVRWTSPLSNRSGEPEIRKYGNPNIQSAYTPDAINAVHPRVA